MLQRAYGDCIRELRHKAGIAQEKLAYASEIDRGYMSRLERGKHGATLEMIYRMLPALNVTFIQFAQAFDAVERRMRHHPKKDGTNG